MRVPDIRSLARTRVARDLLITFGGRWAQMLLALVGNVVSARALGPDDFGRFGLVMATLMICGTLADAGLTYTAVRYIAQYSTSDPARALTVARVYFFLRFGSGALVGSLGLLLAAPLAGVLGQAGLTPYLQLAFGTLFSLGLSSYPGTILVGLGRFGRLGTAGVVNAAITLAGILLLLALGQLDLGTLIAWNVILPVVSTLPAWLLLPPGWLPWRIMPGAGPGWTRTTVRREILGFSKWMVVSNVGSILAQQGDLLLLGRLSSPAVVGVYSVALTLAGRLDTLNQSLLTVLLPRASRLQGAGAMRRYSRRVLAGTLLLAGLLGLFALLAQPAITLLYGERYTAAAGLFLALLGIVLFDLVTSSLILLAFPLNRPRVLAAAEWLRVGVLGVAGGLLIPDFGGFGAAIARFLSRVGGTAWTLYAVRRALKADPEDTEPRPVIESFGINK